jgi:Tol biopolymer transport system component
MEKLEKLGGRFWPRIGLLALVAGLASPALARPLQLVSVPDPAQRPPAGGGGDSYAPIISPDGRYVLFASTANNLVLTSNNAPIPLNVPPTLNVFLRDRTNQATTLVSVNLSGTAGGNGDSWPCGVSADGRYALFESSASDLVAGDTNGVADAFVRDLLAGTTLLVSVSTNGGSANGASRNPVMTPDGRYVAFVSDASNLVPNDTNGIADVFVRDLQAQATTLVSVGATYVSPPSSSGITGSFSDSPVISADGRYVAFYSTASNLVSGVQTVGDIYVRDLVGATTVWASTYARTAVRSVLGPGATRAVCFNHASSADGQFVAYEASPNVGQTASTVGVILRYDQGTGLTDIVHTNGAVPTAAYEDLRNLDMTPDGRFIAFVANTNGTMGTSTCISVWDAQSSTMTLASVDLSNAVSTNATCDWPALDSSGRFVAFLSSATNLVTNTIVGDYHLYVRDMQAGVTVLIDGDTNGVGSPMSPATAPRFSADGRFVAFESSAGAVVPDNRNRDYGVFVREFGTGAAELISARHAALPSLSPNGSSKLSILSVSANGRFIAFTSDADNLVPNDTNGCPDIFVNDLLLTTNILVSMGTNGVAADGFSREPSISADGRYVAFTSSADNLVAGDTNQASDVFVRDLQSATIALVSVSTSGTGPGNGSSYSPWISADGRYVLFHSLAQNLAAGSFIAGYESLFLRDLQLGTNYALTHTSSGSPVGAMTPDGRFVAFAGMIQPYSLTNLYLWDSLSAQLIYTNAVSGILNLAISPDGSRIVYNTASGLCVVDRLAGTNGLIGAGSPVQHAGLGFSGDGRFLAYAAPLNNTNQVCLYDFLTGTNLLVSGNCTSGEAAYGASDSPDISSDGRFVAYRSAASNLVPVGAGGVPNIFLYDRQEHTTTLLSASSLGPWASDNFSLSPVFSADGRTLVFRSWASDLVPQDFNQGSDLFAFSLYASSPIPLFSATLVSRTSLGEGPWITWPVVAGRTYRVEFKNSLGEAEWQPVSQNLTVVGSQAWLYDPSPGPGQRFYRVVGQ